MLRCSHTQDVQCMHQYILNSCHQPQSGLGQRPLHTEDAALAVELMKQTGQFIGISGHTVRCPLPGRCGNQIMIFFIFLIKLISQSSVRRPKSVSSQRPQEMPASAACRYRLCIRALAYWI